MVESERDDLLRITQQLRRLNAAPAPDLRRGRARVLAQAARQERARTPWAKAAQAAAEAWGRRIAPRAMGWSRVREGLAFASVAALVLIVLAAGLVVSASLFWPAGNELASTPTLALTRAPQSETQPVKAGAVIGLTVTPARSDLPAGVDPTPQPALAPEGTLAPPHAPAGVRDGLRPPRVVPTVMHTLQAGTLSPGSD